MAQTREEALQGVANHVETLQRVFSGLDALRRAISGLPQVAEAIAAVPANERSKALTAAETSYLQSALELGYSDSEARDWVTAVIFAADPGAGASVIRRKGFSAKCKHSIGRLNKQSPRRAKFCLALQQSGLCTRHHRTRRDRA